MNGDVLDQHARTIVNAAVDAVPPENAMQRESLAALLGEAVTHASRVFVFGMGKAGAAMARALEDTTGIVPAAGAVVIPSGYLTGLPDRYRPEAVELVPGGHPHPTRESIVAARRIMTLAAQCREDDLAIVLISGGGSALFADFAEGITLEDAREAFDQLLASGASIGEMNVVRKHLSIVSGGRLAAAIHPGRCLALAISDVPGDDPSVIASGPTVGDPSIFADVVEVVEKYALADSLPAPVMAFIREGMNGNREESVKPDALELSRSEFHIVARNRDALHAAAAAASELGYRVEDVDGSMEGDASNMGCTLAERMRRSDVNLQTCWVLGGETTVKLDGAPGLGGRNQELALSAALHLNGDDHESVILSAGTDGIDGPTDAAGAVARSDTLERARRLGLDADDFLQRHDSHTFFRELGDLVITGPTHTNVMDVVIGLRAPR